MNRWRAFAACWLVALASCASDGGQRGTGITVAAGNAESSCKLSPDTEIPARTTAAIATLTGLCRASQLARNAT